MFHRPHILHASRGWSHFGGIRPTASLRSSQPTALLEAVNRASSGSQPTALQELTTAPIHLGSWRPFSGQADFPLTRNGDIPKFACSITPNGDIPMFACSTTLLK
ncbi:hypothetical protein Fot_35148 [Forsythia ovata]|uniref:Uncharacterized protein n=1 Tax=Forsythia ovata TaxID=205694 RepID=A0ABD1SKZ7_9LAMI